MFWRRLSRKLWPVLAAVAAAALANGLYLLAVHALLKATGDPGVAFLALVLGLPVVSLSAVRFAGRAVARCFGPIE